MWKNANKEINRVHKRVLSTLLREYDAPFDGLLAKNEEKTDHVQNLWVPMMKSMNYLSIIKNTLLLMGFNCKGRNELQYDR